MTHRTHLCTCCGESVAAKGSLWLKTDILRVIAKTRAECPDARVNPTRARGKGEPQPIVERQPVRRGRKTTLTPAALLAWYERARDCGNLVMLTVAQVVEQLSVSRATVERCEQALRQAGQIERRTFNRRQSSLIELLRPAQEATARKLAAVIELPKLSVTELDEAQTPGSVFYSRAPRRAEPVRLQVAEAADDGAERPLTIAVWYT